MKFTQVRLANFPIHISLSYMYREIGNIVKIATLCINFFVCINVAKFAISVWRFSPHCVVKFTIVYSTNYKTVWESIVWELLRYSVRFLLFFTVYDFCCSAKTVRNTRAYHCYKPIDNKKIQCKAFSAANSDGVQRILK